MGLNFNELKSFCSASCVKSILHTKPLNTNSINLKDFKPVLKKGNLKADTFVKNEAKFAKIYSHYDEGGTIATAYPKSYTELSGKEYIEPYERIIKFGPDKGKVKTFGGYYDETYKLKPHYHIDKLWTGGKGTGTAAVQDVVKTSMENPVTKGRVTLDACCIDGKTAPGAFYYKLGFRFKDPKINEELETWLKAGGKRENAPFCVGGMYLPEENIQHCINYGKNINT